MRLQFFDSAVIANSKLNYSGDVYVAYHMKRRVLFKARLLAIVKSFARLDRLRSWFVYASLCV